MRKLRCKKGFTLIEMLACVITLVMITLICTTGLNMAMRSYNESLFESNSQMLESTLSTSIGDILRYSYDISDYGTNITFSNTSYLVQDASLKINSDGRFVLVISGATERLLLGTNVYAGNLYVDEFSISYDGATGVFEGAYKIKSTILEDREREVNFTFKTIANGM